MSNNRFVFDGLEEFRAQLRALPAELAAEAEIDAAYPERAGALRKGLTVKHETSAFGATAIVRNTAPHAEEFENGTQARHTALGANRGAMPPGHVFVPIITRHRRAMYQALGAMLTRVGFVVSGSA